MESALYGIYVRVVDVSQIERASKISDTKATECVKTVQSTFHVV